MLAPGFYECTSRVVVNVVPRGALSNVTEIPVPGQCGHRYQEGDASVTTATCSCGMFAVGVCATCTRSRCGQHARHDDAGRFVCNDHIADTQRQQAEESYARWQADKEEAGAALAKERELIGEALPGFPAKAPASCVDVAEALERHVPERKQTFKKIPGKLLDRRGRGWSFCLGQLDLYAESRERQDTKLYLIVLDDGSATVQKGIGPPMDVFRLDSGQVLSSLNTKQLHKVTRQVLEWAGRQLASSPTMRQRYLAEFAGKGSMPNYTVWATSYERATRPDFGYEES